MTLFVDINGNYDNIHSDIIHRQQLNKLKNWWCTAGLRHLYIDFDGNVWRGTCEQDGCLGNVFRPGMIFQDKKEIWRTWAECEKEICACGADFNCPKVKNEAFLPNITDTSKWDILSENFPKLNKNQKINNPILIMDDFAKEAKTIAWDLGRRCNYNCSYCPSSVHNNFETHKSLDSLNLALDNINNHWRYNERLKWTFTGGEPTTNKDLLPFLKQLYQLGDALHVQTNASRNINYYEELFEISSIGFSIHLDYFNENHIINLVDKLSQIKNNEVLEIRIMLKPTMLDKAKKLYENLEKYKSEKIHLNVDLLHEMENKTIINYNEKELEWLKSLS